MISFYDTCYLFCLIILWWSYSGYFIFLYLIFKRYINIRSSQELPGQELPGVSVIIPVHNEENLIAAKIDNILETDYPKDKLEVIVADGLSDDRTKEIVKAKIKGYPFIRFYQTKKKGKIPQINSALNEVKYNIVVNTDVDGILEKGTILEIVYSLVSNHADVAGAFTISTNCLEEEKYFWQVQNSIRLLESKNKLSFSVVAACYGFNKNIIDKFPEDVIADDVYLPFLANLKGYRTVYLESAKAYETRSAKSLKEMMKHKRRKSNADIREIFRFIKYIPDMKPKWAIIYFTKFLQMVFAPFMVILFPILFIRELLEKNILFIVSSLTTVLVSIFLSNKILIRNNKSKESFLVSTFWNIKMFILTTYILIITVIRYPFFKQTSSYKKIA